MKFLILSLLFALMPFLIGCLTKSEPFNSKQTPQPTKVVFLPTITQIPTPSPITSPIPLPPDGHLYHGVYPGGNEKEDVTLKDLLDYERAVGKTATWVYFSTYWFESREFPTNISTWIRNSGSIPYIRMMLQSEYKFDGKETVYTLDNILAGQFDSDLHAWCVSARQFSDHLIVEYGTEMDTAMFPWSGSRNGGGRLDGYGDPSLPDGPERFRDAYRHIIQICRNAGAVNITWVFHTASDYDPEDPDNVWNRIDYYYPGDDWIDWIGVSVYGVHTPMASYYDIFQENMDHIHPLILKMAPHKPIIIAELGSAKNNPFLDQVEWTRDALTAITSLRYQNLIGFAWWNEAWQNDDDPSHDTTMRIQDNPDLQTLFRELLGANPIVIGEISP
jgi:hypothetical protein